MRVATVAISVAFFATTASTQQKVRLGQQPPTLPSACGPEATSFQVNLTKPSSTPASPEPGKATVYFIHDNGTLVFRIGETDVVRIGVDGQWVGANKHNSFFSVSLDPGEHHICASMFGDLIELAHFRAEAGKIYYFRSRYPSNGYLPLAAVDSDEAKYEISIFPLSVSQPKK